MKKNLRPVIIGSTLRVKKSFAEKKLADGYFHSVDADGWRELLAGKKLTVTKVLVSNNKTFKVYVDSLDGTWTSHALEFIEEFLPEDLFTL